MRRTEFTLGARHVHTAVGIHDLDGADLLSRFALVERRQQLKIKMAELSQLYD